MHKLTRWGFALALLPLAACGPNRQPLQPSAPMTSPPPAANLSAADQNFVQTAVASDKFEMESSALAQQKSRNPAIRRFADRMIADHGQTTQQLSSMLQAKGVSVTPTYSQDEQLKIDAMGRASNGGPFDREYRNAQVTAHEDAIKAFQEEATNGYDADLRGFAQQTLPTLRDHLAMARRLAGRR